jgi:hypothetical protein
VYFFSFSSIVVLRLVSNLMYVFSFSSIVVLSQQSDVCLGFPLHSCFAVSWSTVWFMSWVFLYSCLELG